MDTCIICDKPCNTIVNDRCICDNCQKTEWHDELHEKSEAIACSGDFKSWKLTDLSELFWIHLSEYQKTPNEKSLHLLKTAYLWAVHADKALANAMYHALNWADININKK